MRNPLVRLMGGTLLVTAALHADDVVSPSEPDGIARCMEQFVKAREIAGAVTLVAEEGRPPRVSCVGLADVESGKPMTPEAMFWIASMTKPVTATAVMMMEEQGKLSVDDPASKYIPEFADLKNSAGEKVTVTIRQCLTHSSGLGDVTLEETSNITTLKDLIPLIVAKPVNFQPDSKWAYCQSGINTVARIVEVVSGESFPDFLRKHLFDPLGMNDTTFYPTADQAGRIASSYRRTPAGALEKVGIPFIGGKSLMDRKRYPRANGGLFSTVGDYAKFAWMILNGGELDGHRYLKPESVVKMTTVQSGDLQTGFTPGNGWGLGWCVVREPQGVSATLSPGTFGHGGMFGTQAWIDPGKKRIHLLMVQRADFPNSDASDVRKGFHEAAASLP